MVYPRFCLHCGEALQPSSPQGLCVHCSANAPLNLPPYCNRCGRHSDTSVCEPCNTAADSPLARISYILKYQTHGKRWIQRFKIHASPEWIPLWRCWIRRYFAASHESLHLVDAIVPVPPHRSKPLDSWSAAREFARLISEIAGIPVADILSRTRPLRKQSDLSREERAENVRGAYTLSRPLKSREKTVLIVDDVITTEATARECARVLKASGATRVECFAGARAPLRSEHP